MSLEIASSAALYLIAGLAVIRLGPWGRSYSDRDHVSPSMRPFRRPAPRFWNPAQPVQKLRTRLDDLRTRFDDLRVRIDDPRTRFDHLRAR